MNKKDRKHVEKLIKKGFYKPGLLKEMLMLSFSIKLDRMFKEIRGILNEKNNSTV